MKKLFSTIIFHPLTLLIATVLVVLAIVNLRTNLKRLELSEQNIKLEQEEGNRLKSEIQLLDDQIEQSSQPLAKERLIRNELVRQVEGEIVLKLPDIEINQDLAEEAIKKNNWEEWIEIISQKK
jgi:hypothetical protein